MTPNEDLFLRAMQAFNRGFAGEPGTRHPRQIGKTAAGVQAVVDALAPSARDERAAFEAFLGDCGRSAVRDANTGNYVSFGADLAWQAWQSAASQPRAALTEASDVIAFPQEPTEAMEWAFHNGVRPGARNNFLNRYRAMRDALILDLAAERGVDQ